MGMRTHINGMRILCEVMKEPGWWDGIVYDPDSGYPGDGRKFVVFRNWDGKSNHWGSGIYGLTLDEARRKIGLSICSALSEEEE